MWDSNDFAWNEMFAALSAYKHDHGNCNVPALWKENPSLGKWCSNQRTSYRIKRLTDDRIKRLRDIGFQFVVRVIKRD